jgi:hypothetical protein
VDARSWAFTFRPCRIGPAQWVYAFYDGDTLVVSGVGTTEDLALEALGQLLREGHCHPDAIAITDARLAVLRSDAQQDAI